MMRATETWRLAAPALATCCEFGVWQSSCVAWSMNCTCGTPTLAPTVPVGLQLLEREGFEMADLRRNGGVRLEELTGLLGGRARVRQQVRTRQPPKLRTFPPVNFSKTTLLLQLRERELQRKKCFPGQEHQRSAPQHERDGCSPKPKDKSGVLYDELTSENKKKFEASRFKEIDNLLKLGALSVMSVKDSEHFGKNST